MVAQTLTTSVIVMKLSTVLKVQLALLLNNQCHNLTNAKHCCDEDCSRRTVLCALPLIVLNLMLFL
jgi:hypothetical protein